MHAESGPVVLLETPHAHDDVPKHSKELAKGALFSFMGNIFFKAISFAYIVLIAKVVAQEDLGLFYLAMGFVSVTAIADDLGLSSSLTRYIPFFEGKGQGAKIQRLVRLSLVLVSAVALLLMAALWLLSGTIGSIYQNPRLAGAIQALTVYLLLTNLFKVCGNILLGARSIASMQLVRNLQNLFKLVFTVALLQFLGPTFETVAFGMLLSYVAIIPIASIQSFRVLARMGEGGPRLETHQLLTDILPYGLMMNLYQSLGAAMAGANSMLLGYFTAPALSEKTVAVFSVVTALSYALMAFQSSIGTIFLPLMSNLYGKGNLAQMREVTETAQRWALFLSLPFGICLILLSPDIIISVYGEKFLSGSLTMSIFSAGLLITAFAAMLPSALSAMRLVRIQLRILLLSGAANVLLGVALIPSFGMEGAAVAAASGSIISSVMYYWFAARHLGFRMPGRTLRLAAAGAMAAAVILLLRPAIPVALPFPPTGMHLADEAIGLAFTIVKIMGAGALFLSATALLKCFKQEDVGIVRKVMQKARMPEWTISLSSRALALGVSG